MLNFKLLSIKFIDSPLDFFLDTRTSYHLVSDLVIDNDIEWAT